MRQEEIFLAFEKKYYKLLRKLHLDSHQVDLLEHFILSKVNATTTEPCQFYFDNNKQKMIVQIDGGPIINSKASELVEYFKKNYDDQEASWRISPHSEPTKRYFELNCEKVCDKLFDEFKIYLNEIKTKPDQLKPYLDQSKNSTADFAQQVIEEIKKLEASKPFASKFYTFNPNNEKLEKYVLTAVKDGYFIGTLDIERLLCNIKTAVSDAPDENNLTMCKSFLSIMKNLIEEKNPEIKIFGELATKLESFFQSALKNVYRLAAPQFNADDNPNIPLALAKPAPSTTTNKTNYMKTIYNVGIFAGGIALGLFAAYKLSQGEDKLTDILTDSPSP